MGQRGTTQRLTTLSPILPDRLRELTNRLRVVRYTPGLGQPLLQLGFIHYARWTILEWLPPPTGNGGCRGLRWKYLLFESNYDGDEDEYYRTFADILPARLAKLWGACYGFEDAAEREQAGAVTLVPSSFRAFISRNELDIIDHYAAYPKATTIDVRQAIDMHAKVDDASRDRPTEKVALQRVADAGPMALGPFAPQLTVRERVQAVRDPWGRAVRGRYGVNPLTIVTPLAPGRERTLRELCDQRSLLDDLEQTETHFARLAIIPRYLTDVSQPNPDLLETSYLLFTSDSWGQAYDHIEALRTKLATTAELIWGKCPGYPGHHERHRARFHAWVNSHTVPTRYYVAGYPPRSVSEIKRYLRDRARVAQAYDEEPRPSALRLLAEMESDRD
jgi:hypothetical protein